MGERKVIFVKELCERYGLTPEWYYKNSHKIPKVCFNGRPLKPHRFDPTAVDAVFSSSHGAPETPRSLTTKSKKPVKHTVCRPERKESRWD